MQPQPALALVIEIKLDRLDLVLLDSGRCIDAGLRHSVVFDRDLPQYRTTQGLYIFEHDSTMGTTGCVFPVDMIIAALDLALEWLSTQSWPTGRSAPAFLSATQLVTSISVVSQVTSPILLSSSAIPLLCSLDTSLDFHSQLHFPSFLTFPYSAVEGDTTATTEVAELEKAIGHHMGYQRLCEGICLCHDAGRVTHITRSEVSLSLGQKLGTPITTYGWPALMLQFAKGKAVLHEYSTSITSKVCETTSRVVSAAGLMVTLLTGRIACMNPVEAALTGFYNLTTGTWDADILQVFQRLASLPRHRDRWLSEALGDVDSNYGSSGTISSYMRTRYGMSAQCTVSTSLPSHIAAFCSFAPNADDFGLCMGRDDVLILPLRHIVAGHEWTVLPNPMAAFDRGNGHLSRQPPFLAVVKCLEADSARRCVRDKYANGSWSVFDRVIHTVGLGGSVGMDNNFFVFWQGDTSKGPQAKAFSKGHEDTRTASQSLKRYEQGLVVQELSDLRANVRCLLESQAMAQRVLAGRIITQDLHLQIIAPDSMSLPRCKRSFPGSMDFASGYFGVGGALRFDPYDVHLTPVRVLAWGQAACNETLAKFWSSILGGAWVAPVVKERAASGAPSMPRSAIGAVLFALCQHEMTAGNNHGDNGYRGTLLTVLARRDSGTPHTSDRFNLAVSQQPGQSGTGALSTSAALAPTYRARSSSSPPVPTPHKQSYLKAPSMSVFPSTYSMLGNAVNSVGTAPFVSPPISAASTVREARSTSATLQPGVNLPTMAKMPRRSSNVSVRSTLDVLAETDEGQGSPLLPEMTSSNDGFKASRSSASEATSIGGLLSTPPQAEGSQDAPSWSSTHAQGSLRRTPSYVSIFGSGRGRAFTLSTTPVDPVQLRTANLHVSSTDEDTTVTKSSYDEDTASNVQLRSHMVPFRAPLAAAGSSHRSHSDDQLEHIHAPRQSQSNDISDEAMESMLGLKRICDFDSDAQDLWLVYGALIEEFVRLRSGGGSLGSGIGDVVH